MTAVSAKPSAISALNSAKMATKAEKQRLSTTTTIDAANTATAAIPDVIRSHRGTKSAAKTPKQLQGPPIGETLYTCRAAIADAATAVRTVAANATGIA